MIKNNFLKSWLFAHRGLHDLKYDIPENSLPAYQLAINNNYGFELDIQAVDGKFICFHDSTLNRVCNIDKKVHDLSLDELLDTNLLNTNYKIPLFTDVLEMNNGKVPMLIEIKTHPNYKKTLNTFVEIMDKYEGEFAVFSFNPLIVNWFRKNKPSYIRGQITSYFEENKKMPHFAKYLMKTLFFNKITKPDFISYNHLNLPNKYADKAKEDNTIVISYTAKNQQEFDNVLKHYDNVVFENFIPKKNKIEK